MTQGAYLAKKGETVHIRCEGKSLMQVPLHNLDGIVCFGNVTCSPYLMGHCGRQGLAITFLSEHGRFQARVVGETSGNVLLRREQYRRADSPEASAEIARAILTAKVFNSRAVLRRARTDRKIEHSSIDDAMVQLSAALRDLQRPCDLESLRGIEGSAAKYYFGAFDALITKHKDEFFFRRRSRRPPLDTVNALLSFLYTLVTHDMRSALEAVGLDPAVGFLHRDRPGRPSLALDLTEEFRAFLADRLALSLINRGQLRDSDFDHSEGGAVLLNEGGRKLVLGMYQKRKLEEIVHPFLEEKSTVGLLFQIQALLLARYLRGDLDGYPPFTGR